MFRPSSPEPLVARARYLSAVYLPVFCNAPVELDDTGATVTVAAETAPMVQVAPRFRETSPCVDRIVLVTHGAPIRVPASDRETCDPYLFHIAQTIRYGFRRHVEPSAAYLESLAGPLTQHLRHYYAGRTRQRERGGLSEWRLAKALQFIEAHLFEGVEIAELARAACLSPFHFSHMFKRSTGLSPMGYVRKKRMTVAGGLLTSTSLPIAEIARRTGHENQAHFSVSFRRVMGMTPTRYRRIAGRGTPPSAPSPAALRLR